LSAHTFFAASPSWLCPYFSNPHALLLTAFFALVLQPRLVPLPGDRPDISHGTSALQRSRRPVLGACTDITHQAQRHKFWVLNGATIPSEMSPSTHHSTCNTRIQFPFIRNARARSKQCHCVSSTVSAPDVLCLSTIQIDMSCHVLRRHCA
jgi:hypothetical protein